MQSQYWSASAYLATFKGSTSCSSWRLIWKTWAPPRVRFFHWLANKDRCWTAERLRRHRLQHHPRCLLCDQEPETMHHLPIACPFARQAWHDVLWWLRMTCRPPEQEASLNGWWIKARQVTPKILHKGLPSVTLLTAWMIWKEHNSYVFDRGQPSVQRLLERIKTEAKLWATVGATGLRVVLPGDWDVH
jgi:hypothetical protein